MWGLIVVHSKQVFRSNCVHFNEVPLYLRDKPLKYSTVSERMQPVPNDGVPSAYRRKKGAPA